MWPMTVDNSLSSKGAHKTTRPGKIDDQLARIKKRKKSQLF